MLAVPKKQTIFTQGDGVDAVFYIQKGKVRLTVVSKTGSEATIGILNEGNFFGEGALAWHVTATVEGLVQMLIVTVLVTIVLEQRRKRAIRFYVNNRTEYHCS